jgi:hypothetical protein
MSGESLENGSPMSLKGTLRAAVADLRSREELLVFGLLLVFLLSSGFSIFLMQVGYFGALLVWVTGMVRRRSVEIPRTGLEAVFLLFVAAELLSMLWSDFKPQALLYLQRRLLLLPIVYILAAKTRTSALLKTAFWGGS